MNASCVSSAGRRDCRYADDTTRTDRAGCGPGTALVALFTAQGGLPPNLGGPVQVQPAQGRPRALARTHRLADAGAAPVGADRKTTKRGGAGLEASAGQDPSARLG